MTMVKALLPTASPGAAILGVTTGATSMPPTMTPGLSAYIGSKLAQVKLLEYVAAENPNLFVATMHPGMIETAVFQKSGAKADALPMDKVQLPAHFLVWLAGSKAEFLRGRLVWANWDVDELMSQAQEIQSGQQMTVGICGWPYQYVN